MSWQVMIGEQAQAGNRASKTQLYLQWQDNGLECNAETSGELKFHYFILISICASSVCKLHSPSAKSTSTSMHWRIALLALLGQNADVLQQKHHASPGLLNHAFKQPSWARALPRHVRNVYVRELFVCITLCGRCCNWIPFGDHPLKLERYRED